MGEYAEMMLDGTCCSTCGEYLGGGSCGWPVQCPSCSRDAARREPRRRSSNPFNAKTRPFECACGKRFKKLEHQRQHALDTGHEPIGEPS